MFQKDTKEAHFAAVPLFSGLDKKQMSSLMRHVDVVIARLLEARRRIIAGGSRGRRRKDCDR